MRVLSLLVLLICCFGTLFSQELKKGDVIRLITKIKVQKNVSSYDGKNQEFPEYLGEYLFKISNIGDDNIDLVPLHFPPENKDSLKVSKDKSISLSDLYNNKIFTVKKSDLLGSYTVQESIDKVTVGILSLPFKLRPQDNYAYEDKLNLNSTIHFHAFSYGNSRFGVQVGAGIGSVSINEDNAFGEIDSSLTSVPNLSIMSGLMYSYKFVQCGLYFGFDFINDQDKINWKHNGNLWIGLGIGFKIFSVSASSDEENN